MPTRRAFLASLLAVTAPMPGWAAAGDPAFLACAKTPRGGYVLAGLRADGAEAFRVPLPARGHAGCAHPHRPEAVGFARRPGTYGLVIDCLSGDMTRKLTAPEGRHFNGHGCYSADGAVLYTAEQMAEGSAGRIGLWDVDGGYARMGDLDSHGIGPHDVRLMPDGRTLVVANGGIQTDGARGKLNIETMRPNLSYHDPERGLLELVELEPELWQNSIRHLALRADGLVGFAMQWEGEEGAATPLLGLHRRGADPILCSAPLPDELAMIGYAGSVSFAGDGSEIAITSPRGGRVHRFSDRGAFLGAVHRDDVCGLAPLTGGYLGSDGLGGLIRVGPDGAAPLGRSDLSWDNHIVALA